MSPNVRMWIIRGLIMAALTGGFAYALGGNPATTSTAPHYVSQTVPAPSGFVCMHFDPIPGATFPPTTESNITVTIDATGETLCAPIEATK